MSALQEVSQSQEIPDELKAFVLTVVGKLFWKWYRDHEQDKLLSVGWWFIKKTVRVHDLHGLFELLFGKEPVAA